MNDCLFCKIVSSEIPSTKIWESDSHVAFFDIFPNCYGQTLVIPKKHFDSKIFEMPEDAYSDLLKASKKVANLLKKKLQLERVGMIVE
jgi:histidine triad (HIT) family protein